MQDAHGSALYFATFECFLTRAAGASVDILVDAWKQADIGAHHSCKLLLNCVFSQAAPPFPYPLTLQSVAYRSGCRSEARNRVVMHE
jgi:hypothetical protein